MLERFLKAIVIFILVYIVLVLANLPFPGLIALAVGIIAFLTINTPWRR